MYVQFQTNSGNIGLDQIQYNFTYQTSNTTYMWFMNT